MPTESLLNPSTGENMDSKKQRKPAVKCEERNNKRSRARRALNIDQTDRYNVLLVLMNVRTGMLYRQL